MIDAQTIDKLLELPASDRLAIAAALWDSLVPDQAAVPVPDWHREILDQRIADDDAETEPGECWANVRLRIESAR